MAQKRINESKSSPESLIAPCGMDCRLCRAYGRAINPCPGCRGDDSAKVKSCLACRIKNCEKLANGAISYCCECDSFPCAVLNHLDRRYRTRYGISVIANLNEINKVGIRQFLNNEVQRWMCPACGAMLCVHKSECTRCQHVWRE